MLPSEEIDAYLSKFDGLISKKRDIRKRATRYIIWLTIVLALALILHIGVHINYLQKEYPVAFSWYKRTFGYMYPLRKTATQQDPGECFRSMWDVCTQVSFDCLQKKLTLLAFQQTTKPEQAMFLYLCAHHFGGDEKYDLTAEKWDYPGCSSGLTSEWYLGLTEEYLPIAYVNEQGVSDEPIVVQGKMWEAWQATKEKNPFYHFFPDNKAEFFGLPVIKQYAFKRRGNLTADLEYLYFGGLCMVAEMCIIDTESSMATFNRFFKPQYLESCSCGARATAQAVSGGLNAAATMAMMPGMDAMLVEFPVGTAVAVGAMAAFAVVGGIAGGKMAKAECEFEFDQSIGKME